MYSAPPSRALAMVEWSGGGAPPLAAAAAGAVGYGLGYARAGEGVRRDAGTLDRIAGGRVDVRDLIAGGDRLHDRVVVRVRILLVPERTARRAEVADVHQVHGVPRGTDLRPDL